MDIEQYTLGSVRATCASNRSRFGVLPCSYGIGRARKIVLRVNSNIRLIESEALPERSATDRVSSQAHQDRLRAGQTSDRARQGRNDARQSSIEALPAGEHDAHVMIETGSARLHSHGAATRCGDRRQRQARIVSFSAREHEMLALAQVVS
jgi:hypothetical protein